MNIKKYKLLEWVCSIVGIIGLFITANGNPFIGFIIATLNSLLFIIYNYKTKQYGLLTMSVSYLLVEIYGILQWGKIL